jgi:hypothetical protein
MSALLTITEPSGTITAGQSVTYSFSFAGPYPVNWTFSQWGTTKSLTATDNSTASVTLTVPADPNATGGTLSFYGTGESPATYYLKPLDGFSEKMYPVITTWDGYAAWSINKYGNTKFITNNTTQTFSLSVSAQGRNLALTTGSFPLTVYLTSQQIYPSTGSETTVQTQTYNTLGSYASQTYTTPSVTAGTINRYKLYTTNPSATSFNADTGSTYSSCIPISTTQAPFICVQPVNTTLPVTVLGTQYNATTIGLNFISASSTPTITWYRNAVAVPASWVVTVPNYAGFDTSITVQTSLCTNGDTFYCTITDANGTVTSSTVTLTINTPAVTDVVSVSAAANSTTLLTGKTLTLNSNSNANGAVTYQWNKNGTAIVGATNSSYTAIVTTADSGNIYTVTAKSGTATATSSPVTINVYAKSSSYPVSFPITWSATAATVGSPGSTFNYSWKYDDGTVLLGQSVSKTQSVLGSVTGTVTAVDTTTLSVATASKTIVCTDWSKFSWTNSGLKLYPTASASVSSTMNAYAISPLVVGNYIVNVFDVQNPLNIVVIDSVSITRNEYSGFLGTVGTPLTAFVLTSGPNSGKILVLGSGTGRYGFFDPSNGSFTTSPNSTPSTPSIFAASIRPSVLMGNGKWFVHAVTSFPSNACMTYDPVLDQWANVGMGATSNLTDALFKLPSGKILSASSGTTSTYIYDYNSGIWASGPALPSTYAGGNRWLEQLTDGRIFIITQGASPVQSIWSEGSPSFVNDTEIYPITSQYVSATANNIQRNVVTPDNMIINLGGFVSSVGDTKTILHMVDGIWAISAPLLTTGTVYRQCFAGGRAWRCTGGMIAEYSSVW